MAGNLTAMIAAAFSGGGAPPVTSDPYFEYTTLLLPGNGTNGAQNNTFLDGSTNNFTITRNGNTTQGTFSPFSQTGWGNYFNGSSSLTSSSLGTSIGTGDFSLEFFIFQTASAGIVTQLQLTMSDGNAIYLQTNSGAARFLSNSGISAISGGTVNINTWNHLLATRQGSTVRLFVNGVLVASTTSSTSFTTPTSVYIGGSTTLYLTSVRACIGSVPTSYQTSSTTNGTTIFTPPTSLLTTSSQGATSADVKLLTCQSNRFIDISDSPKTFTISGSPTVVAFSPFNPSASWSAATYGGSGYFDGSGDYLTAPYNVDTSTFAGDFCVECFVYFNALPSSKTYGMKLLTAGSGSGTGWYLHAPNSNVIEWINYGSGVNLTGATTIVPGQWYHVAAVRSGSNFSLYLNGARQATSSSGGASIGNSALTALFIGTYSGDPTNSSFQLNGYMSAARIVKGSSVYDPTQTSITVPTAPLTAITNTSLLLNYTNAGIYDATSKNDLETVGNAQISTTQSKWGGSSMYFDGTGDYLAFQDSDLFAFGSGDLTIECWVYATTSGLAQGIAGQANSSVTASLTSFILYLSSISKISVEFYVGSTIYAATSSNNLVYNQWNHIAVVRDGGTIRLYINGQQDGTVAISGTINDSTNQLAIGRPGEYNSWYWNGYIQDLRITKGVARYTANFTPPTAAFPTL